MLGVHGFTFLNVLLEFFMWIQGVLKIFKGWFRELQGILDGFHVARTIFRNFLYWVHRCYNLF